LDTGPERNVAGILLSAEFTWPGHAHRATLHGLPNDEATELRSALRRTVSVDLSAYDRMSLVFESDAFPLPRGSALLARHDRKGHLLVWPDESSYRVVPEGALRALFREHRVDVTPALSPLVEPGRNGHRFDSDTEVVDLTTAHGKLHLEQLPVQDLGFGGALLCRFLLDFIAATPPNEVCRDDTIPVHALYDFEPKGELEFSVVSLRRKADTTASVTGPPVVVPPRRTRFVEQGLPPLPDGVLEARYASALHGGPPDAPAVRGRAKNPSIRAANGLLDDTPVAIVPPRQKRTLGGFREGQYQLSSLTFLGEELLPPSAVTIPGAIAVAKPTARLDAGTE
jgi:hypothetical protein